MPPRARVDPRAPALRYALGSLPALTSLSSTILAVMIALAPPGQAASSVVLEPSCGATPGKPACDVTPPPSWSPFYKTFVRPETRAEALKRYLVIARAIEGVSASMTNAPKRDDGSIAPPLWAGSSEELALSLVTIAYHESSFRRDVHSGVGPYALGDCAYWDRTGRRVPASEARKQGVAGTNCQSVCLMQLNTGGLSGARDGFRGSDLVGLDQASTERCFTAGARALAEARARCAASAGDGWFARSVGSYVTGDVCEVDADWVKARAATFTKVGSIRPSSLPKDARELFAEGSP